MDSRMFLAEISKEVHYFVIYSEQISLQLDVCCGCLNAHTFIHSCECIKNCLAAWHDISTNLVDRSVF